MRGDGETPENSFYVGDYRIDTGNNTVMIGDHKRHVEPRAMQVLKVLAQRSGETVTRTELLRVVWGDRIVVEEALTRVISQLRAAFNDSKQRQTIQTVPKKGYRLTARVVWDNQPPSSPTPQDMSITEQPSSTTGLSSQPAAPSPLPPLSAPNTQSPEAKKAGSVFGNKRLYWFAIVLIAVFTSMLMFLFKNESTQTSVDRQVSVAVLPLEQLSGDQETFYLAEGLPEELMGALAHVPELQVPSRYSAFAVAAREDNEEDIADALDVRYLLEGSVRRVENDFRIAVRLVDTERGRVIWSQTYDDSASRLYDIPDDIAASILNTLFPQRANSEARISRGGVNNAQAYQHYLKGMYWLMNGKTSEWFYRAEAAFKSAVEADPGYAAAYGSLAYVYARHNYHDNFMEAAQAQKLADQAISTALQLQPDEPHALFAEAIINTSQGNYADAEAALQTVLQTSADHVTALYLYSELALARNQFDEALQFAIQAKQADTFSPWVNVNLAIVRFWRGELEAALEAAETAIRIDNDYTWAYVWKAKILQHKGDIAMAVKAMENCTTIDASSPVNNAYLGLLYLELGFNQRAWQWFDKTATFYGDSSDARFWQQFERFAYLRQDPDIGVNLLQQLVLLDNRVFSLLPVLYHLQRQSRQNAQSASLPTFSGYSATPFSQVNYLNQHYYFAARALELVSDSDNAGQPFITATRPPQRKDYLYQPTYSFDHFLPWQWMLPASAFTERYRAQRQASRARQMNIYQSEQQD